MSSDSLELKKLEKELEKELRFLNSPVELTNGLQMSQGSFLARFQFFITNFSLILASVKHLASTRKRFGFQTARAEDAEGAKGKSFTIRLEILESSKVEFNTG